MLMHNIYAYAYESVIDYALQHTYIIMYKYKCNFTGFTGNVLDLKQLVLRKMSEHIYASRCDARDVMGHHPKYELL